jgi:hypothetical protein
MVTIRSCIKLSVHMHAQVVSMENIVLRHT